MALAVVSPIPTLPSCFASFIFLGRTRLSNWKKGSISRFRECSAKESPEELLKSEPSHQLPNESRNFLIERDFVSSFRTFCISNIQNIVTKRVLPDHRRCKRLSTDITLLSSSIATIGIAIVPPWKVRIRVNWSNLKLNKRIGITNCRIKM